MSKRKWYYDWKAGLVKEDGQPYYVCRGFKKENGNLIAAAPEMYDALLWLRDNIPHFYGDLIEDGMIRLRLPGDAIDAVMDALAKAEGKRD